MNVEQIIEARAKTLTDADYMSIVNMLKRLAATNPLLKAKIISQMEHPTLEMCSRQTIVRLYHYVICVQDQFKKAVN